MKRLVHLQQLAPMRSEWRDENKTVVFTNGCFDLLHRGHIEYLRRARALGNILIVGLNSDDSVRRLKGEKRPILSQEDRAEILLELRSVDFVVIFDEDTPQDLVEFIEPDILVKGADYEEHEIVGGDAVRRAGGRVERIPLVTGRASSNIISDILRKYSVE